MAAALSGGQPRERRAITQNAFNRMLLAILGAGLVVLAMLGGAFVWLSLKTHEYNGWVDHTYVAQQSIVSFTESVERSETARRGYLLSQTQRQYDAYRRSKSAVDVALHDLADKTKDNEAQRLSLAKIRPLLTWKVKVNDDSVALAQAGRQREAIEAFPAEQMLQPLLGIRAVTDAMLAEERRLLQTRLEREQGAIRLLSYVGGAAALLLGILSLVSIAVMRRFADGLTRAQAALTRLNQTLEQRVEERTVDLTRANQEIQRFAYIISHDLRSPLVNVMGFTSELEEAMKPVTSLVRRAEEVIAEIERLQGPVRDAALAADQGAVRAAIQAVDSDIPEAVGFIRSSTRKMDGLISAILKLSREGRRVLRPEPLAMAALVEGLLATVRHRMDGLGGESTIEAPLPDLVSDRFAVEQVLGNLIDNAVKYSSPKRPLRIVVRGTQAHGRVIYEIQDNGRGIDPRDHDRIFDLFRRSGVQNQPGEGIGLAHVRALVHRLGGVITCTSALDQGAVFRLSLPSVLVSTEGSQV